MNKKQILSLAKNSFENGKLNENRVKLVSARLKRQELRSYIQQIETIESKNSVVITLPTKPSETLKDKFGNLFKTQEIVYNIDASLFPGIRIQQGDLLYEVSLKNSLDTLLSHLKEHYDS